MRRLKYLRLMQELTLDNLEKMSSVNKSYISRAERHGDWPGTGQLNRLAEALGWEDDAKLLMEEIGNAKR